MSLCETNSDLRPDRHRTLQGLKATKDTHGLYPNCILCCFIAHNCPAIFQANRTPREHPKLAEPKVTARERSRASLVIFQNVKEPRQPLRTGRTTISNEILHCKACLELCRKHRRFHSRPSTLCHAGDQGKVAMARLVVESGLSGFESETPRSRRKSSKLRWSLFTCQRETSVCLLTNPCRCRGRYQLRDRILSASAPPGPLLLE